MDWTETFGLAMPELGWVPAPRYALRRQRILSLLDRLPPGEALEIGCGSGALCADLTRRGFQWTGLETSPPAREIAANVATSFPPAAVYAGPQPGWSGRFALVMAFEVLEHIKDDVGALDSWCTWLQPTGRLILSVPAFGRRWGASDVFVGHMRRYDRGPLLAVLAAAGLAVEALECYGFPLANLTDAVRMRVHAGRLRREAGAGVALAPSERTAHSGIERGIETRLYPWQRSLPGRVAFRVAYGVQRWFLDRELGSGWLVLARRA